MNISRSNECGIMKILTVFPLLVGESTVRIFLCFEICRHKLPFLVCGYRFQNSWDCKGTAGPFTSGFPIGVKRSVGTRFSDGKSSVLYLLRPLPLERGVFASGTHHFQRLQNRRILARHGPKFRICFPDKIRLFGCRWCCGAEMILKKSSERSSITGGAEGISHSCPAAATHSKTLLQS